MGVRSGDALAVGQQKGLLVRTLRRLPYLT
jgi:hypothetical protein